MIQLKVFSFATLGYSLRTSASLLAATLFISTPVVAQSSFQDGEGAVDYSDSAGPATPSVPGKVTSPSDDGKTVHRSFQPQTGRRAAEKYMGQTPGHDSTSDSESSHRPHEKRSSASDDAHYLAIHFGLYTSDEAYRWGSDAKTNHPGNFNFGVTYRLGEWVNSMDLNARVDFSEYSLQEGISSKLSFLPVITFPDVTSRFPLYFGVGAGLGIFMHQVTNESALAFEYQVLGGVRFFDVLPNTGFFLEGGIKNHLLILTDGQFNGPFVAVGTTFIF